MKIGIADPQTRVRFSLRILLEQQSGYTVVGEAADCEELLELLRTGCPDLLLMDWDLPGMPATSLFGLLREQYPVMQIITMSGRQEAASVSLRAGADGFASKTESPDKLLNLIRDCGSSNK